MNTPSPPQLLFNTDGNWMRHYLPDHDPSAVTKMLPDLVDAGVDALCILLGIDDDLSWRSSKHADMWGDCVEQWDVGDNTRIGGFSADGLQALHQCLCAVIDDGRDLMNIYIDACRNHNVAPYASIRMNDAHTSSEKVEMQVRSRQKRDHPERLIGPTTTPETHGHQWGFCWQWDYAHASVRDRFLGLIDEALERYDFDGVELDWMRQPPFFKPGQEYKHVDDLTDFMAQARRIVDKHTQSRGRPVRLVARVAPNLDQAHTLGMDARAWLSRGFADIFVLASASLTSPEMDITEAVQCAGQCADRQVLVYAGFEAAYKLSSPMDGFEASVPAAQRAAAHNAWAHGAAGAYVFNYDIKAHRAYGVVDDDDLTDDHKQLLRDLTQAETLARKNRCYTVTDAANSGNIGYAQGDPRPMLPRQLPILAHGAGPYHALRVHIADDVAAGLADGRIKQTQLRLRMTEHENQIDRIACQVNGQPVDLNDRPTIKNRWDDTWMVIDDPPVERGDNTVLLALQGHQVPDPWPSVHQCEIVLICT